MENKTLESAIDDILENTEDILNGEIKDGGILEDVKTLVVGGKTTQKPEAPAIWVMLGDTAIDPTTQLGNCEGWDMDLMIAGIIYNSNDSKAGYKEANSLAARAKRVLLADRTLGFGHGSFFADIKSKRFDGNNPYFKNGNHYSAVLTLTTVFTVRE